MKDIEKIVQAEAQKDLNSEMISAYRQLLSFVDATFISGYKHSGDDRAEYLIKNLLSLRDFLKSEIQTRIIKKSVYEELTLKINETKEDQNKKKEQIEKESKVEHQNQESLLETSPSMLLETEED